jgi:hypothetical protein
MSVMPLAELNARVLTPALALLPPSFDTPNARRMLLTIQPQEDAEQRRRQWPAGPARGLWQFEQGGSVAGVLRHRASMAHARRICQLMGVVAEPAAVHAALQDNDPLAAVFARLLLWTDPDPLPTTVEAGWQYYLRTWRPGKPHGHVWPRHWRRASQVLGLPA